MENSEKKEVTTETEEDEERGTWGNQCEFFLSCLGYAVGFGNVWRFPYLCYKNGGAAFLIPYVIMLLCAGLPLFFMELALGQYVSLGPNIIFPKLAPIFYGLGWGMVVVSVLVSIYYNIILAWALFYTFASFTSTLPWASCGNAFNSPASGAGVVSGRVLAKGVKSSGKVVYFTALFPYVVLVILLVRGLTLEGANLGIEFYFLQPNVSRLAEVEVWSDAATQIFYSLGSSFGGLITLASYNKFRNNCMRDAIVIAVANCATSVFAGFVIFSILGFLATELGVQVKDVASSGSALAFIAYPAAVARMPVSPLWSILFFVMLVTLGLDSQFTMVETVTTALFDQFESLRSKKPLVVGGTCFLLFLMGLTMCLEGGVYMFELFFFFSSGISVIMLAFFEVVAIQYVYGVKNFMRNIHEGMGIHIPLPLYAYWMSTWFIITPLSLLIICVFSLVFFVPAYWGEYVFPGGIQALGWLMCFSSVIFVPLGAIYAFLTKDKRDLGLFETSEDFCPAHVRKSRAASKSTGPPQAKELGDSGGVLPVYQNKAFADGDEDAAEKY
ncbi:sodium- and chloride-dependent glycine transporter 1-like [Penaeus chinensis]|uniref:sodium- and chloride-dependent glycine transporter 1-like n=1 Tax=Penaeus chinensis TaxID=139456 RepID=UPI001FB602B1|nr:sodium- and chloride-dependent glycine transporter 1-like [Penaeus chinensis]